MASLKTIFMLYLVICMTSSDDEVPNVVLPNVASSSKSRRRRTSKVWEDFDLGQDEDGNEVAFCKLCQKQYTAKTSAGTCHLTRHAISCKLRHNSSVQDSRQTTIDCSSGTFRKFDPARAREHVVEYIIRDELPFSTVESSAFRKMCEYLNPETKHMCRRTFKNLAMRRFEFERSKIINFFETTNKRVAMTSDCWTSPNEFAYACTTVHYIDDRWRLNKRILSFLPLDYPHTTRAIFDHVSDIIATHKFKKRVTTMSFDNATNNTAAVEMFKAYLEPPVKGECFHIRCVCHSLNLIVQDGLEILKYYVSNVREAIRFCGVSSTSRYQQFREFCTYNDIRPKKFTLDAPHRWNSTYEMLKMTIPYKLAITTFYNEKQNNAMLSEIDWLNVEFLVDFLKPFFLFTKKLSGHYYPTSNLFLIEICKVTKVFAKYRFQNSLGDVFTTMESKFAKYWNPPISVLLSFSHRP